MILPSAISNVFGYPSEDVAVILAHIRIIPRAPVIVKDRMLSVRGRYGARYHYVACFINCMISLFSNV